MLKAELAKKFVEQITQYTDYNINIMNERGYIIASRDPKRIDTFHDVAYCIMSGSEDMIVTFGENDYPGVKPGINVVLMLDGRRIGVVGVTGNPEEVRPIAQITKMAIETMLKYEKQEAELLKRQNRKERFVNLLTQERSDPATLRNVAKQLDYSENVIRFPVLCILENGMAEKFLEHLKRGEMHREQDISFVMDENQVLIFKVLEERVKDSLFAGYKEATKEYLEKALLWVKQQGKSCRYYVGSFQNSFGLYYYGYQHCKWLETESGAAGDSVFFYDYSDQYLRSKIPMSEMQRVFYIYETNLNDEFKNMYRRIIGSLMKTNWNLVEAARELFMHKNTLLYHYTKIKDKLNVNPGVSASDRDFLKAFYYYLQTKH